MQPADRSDAAPVPGRDGSRRGLSEAVGAAFLMATSAIGPGFLTQTAVFTSTLRADFAFAILASVLVDLAVQVNVWRVLGVARMRGQELASALVPGLGPAVALLVAAGGLAFNIGNVAGCGLGLAVLGVPTRLGAMVSAAFALALLGLPRAGRAMDAFVKVLGALMLALTAAVMLRAGPDYLESLRRSVLPARIEFLPVVTLVGGTVGGYISFSGIHRLLDAGVGGARDVPRLTRASALGIVVTAAMRVLLFLAVLGVVSAPGAALDPANPAASAFRQGAGEWGYLFFGVVLWAASITSVVGCSYTSLSFVRTLWAPLARHPRRALAGFIGVSLLLFLWLERPVGLLILAGALNGMILPATLAVVLLAARRRDLLGAYRHPPALAAIGWLAWLVSVAAGLLALSELRRLLA
jgi:Mn2+/Fe2+ NRAMP family transporter